MILYPHKAIGLRFYDADSGSKSGGGSGDLPKAGTLDLEKVFAELPLADLDEPTRKKFEAARDGLKKDVATLQSNLDTTTQQSREFQSQRDEFEAKLKKIQPDPSLQKDDDFLKATKEIMAKNRFTPEQIESQAPVFAQMLKASGQINLKAFGEHFAPVTGEVIVQQATSAFKEAQETDEIGYLQIPEVAQKTWDLVKERIDQKAVTNTDIVRNLGKMVYVDYVGEQRKANKDVQELRPISTPTTTPGMNTSFSYPGAGRASIPIVSASSDANAPKTQMNSDTDSALKQTFKKMTQGHELKTKPPILAEA
jgi:hypothetical protein